MSLIVILVCRTFDEPVCRQQAQMTMVLGSFFFSGHI